MLHLNYTNEMFDELDLCFLVFGNRLRHSLICAQPHALRHRHCRVSLRRELFDLLTSIEDQGLSTTLIFSMPTGVFCLANGVPAIHLKSQASTGTHTLQAREATSVIVR